MKYVRVKVRERTVEVTWRSDGLEVSIDGGPLDATSAGLDLDPGWTEARHRDELELQEQADEDHTGKWEMT